MMCARGCFTASNWMSFLENNPHQPNLDLVLTLPADDPLSQADKVPKELRAGDLCPTCRAGRLDYDGLLNLSCPHCGYALAGCFT